MFHQFVGGVWILRLCEFLQLNVVIGCVPALGCLGGSALDFLEVEHLSTMSTSPDFPQILSRRPDFEVQLLPLTAARNGLEAGPAQEVQITDNCLVAAHGRVGMASRAEVAPAKATMAEDSTSTPAGL